LKGARVIINFISF